MPPNLRKTPHGYTYLRSIPAELRPLIPGKKTVVKEALGRDRKKALARWAELEIHTTKLFDEARAGLAAGRQKESSLDAFFKKKPATRLKKLSASTEGLAEQLSALYLSGLDNDYSARENQERWFDDEEPVELTGQIDTMIAMLRKAVVSGNVDAFVPVVEQLTMMRGYQLVDESGEDIQRVTYRFLRAAQVGCEILARRQRGEFADTPTLHATPLMAAWELDDQPASKKTKTLSISTLSDVTPLYQAWLSTKDRKSQTTSLSCWQRFVEFCQDAPLSQVGTGKLYDFFEARLHDEVKPWSMGYCTLVRRRFGDAFAIAKTKELCKHNPANELEVMPKIMAEEEKKRGKPRYPYSVHQINTLFKSDWYDLIARNWTGKMKQDLGARYWIPLLCLFHGFRIREPLQLCVTDILIEDVPLIKIRIDEEDLKEKSNRKKDQSEDQLKDKKASLPEKRLKNDSTKRTVPIHPTLVKLGFMDFVEGARRNGRYAPLFPSSLPEVGGGTPMWGRSYEQAFVRYVRDTLDFGSGFGNHSFRHTTEDCLRNVQMNKRMWPAGLSQFYTGRLLTRPLDASLLPPVGSERHYGNGGDPNLMEPWVAQLEYPGLQLPPPFSSWLDGHAAVDPKLITKLDKDWGSIWRNGERQPQ